MLKKKLFKSLKSFTAAAIAALTVTAGIAVTGATGDGFNPAGLLAPTTAYAFEHQSYADSTGYSLRLDGDTWHCVNADGQIDYNYDGLAENEFGWWKVSNGEVDFGFNGLALNEYGWWKVTGGAVDFSYTGMAENEYGWWKVAGGAVDFNFNGIAANQYGSWMMKNGTVDFGYTARCQYDGKIYDVTNGYAVYVADNDTVLNGLVYDDTTDTWSYYVDGILDTDNNGLVEYNGGWFKLENGRLDRSFNGYVSNEMGEWIVKDGAVDFGCTKTDSYKDGNITITKVIENGLVKETKRTMERNVRWYDFDAVTLIHTDTVTVNVDENGRMTEDYYYVDRGVSSPNDDVNGDWMTTAHIGSPDGERYHAGNWEVQSNLNLRDYDGDVAIYLVKTYF